MVTPIAPQNSLHTFDPRLRKLLELGTQRRIIIQGNRIANEKEEYDRLLYMRQRLNLLRSDLRAVDPEAAQHLYRANVKIDRPNLRLIVEPRDSNIGDLLDQFEVGAKVETTVINTAAANELDDLADSLGD